MIALAAGAYFLWPRISGAKSIAASSAGTAPAVLPVVGATARKGDPVATTMLMVGILLAGAAGHTQLPVSALPEVDSPNIQITTFYPGASPEVMASSVTAPL